MTNKKRLFDVTLGSYDGAEVCELVDLFILHQLFQFEGVQNIGLHRDDSLAILENAWSPTSECIKKKIIKLFHKHSLNVIAETSLVQTNSLDVLFNMKWGKYWPYRKPMQLPTTLCPPTFKPPAAIKKQLPSMLAPCFSLLSCNREEFARAIPEYEEAT